MAVAVEFDYAEVLPTVQRAHSQASREDAEDAISTAVCELMAKGTPLTGANVVTRARSRLIDAKKRFDARHASLDAFLEDTEDGAPQDLAVEEVDFEAHVELREMADNPVLRTHLASVEAGVPPTLQPRGAFKGLCKYSDAEVAEVKSLLGDGLTRGQVAERTGIPLCTVERWARGEQRQMKSRPGWSPDLIIATIIDFQRREGRRPTIADCRRDPSLPGRLVIARHMGAGGWRKALAAAGVSLEGVHGQTRY